MNIRSSGYASEDALSTVGEGDGKMTFTVIVKFDIDLFVFLKNYMNYNTSLLLEI